MVNNLEIAGDGGAGSIIGVDGCKGGWIAVSFAAGDLGAAQAKVFKYFKCLLKTFAPGATIAVDMPIGLPERTGRGGRAADREAKVFLMSRGASVFSVPSRRAVFTQAYPQACEVARETSEGQKAFSIQAFSIFPRIREIDGLLQQDHALRGQVFETHPEVSFALMNGGTPLAPKKIKGRINKSGMEQRKALLARQGFALDFLKEKPPRSAAEDDFYDACACAWSGARILREGARAFPPEPEAEVDATGLRVAIWG
ncbi:DUF429 domain-containing protein [Methylocapsa acidiphila]|uniref:DUF429 domain-containing protein n=1 Tax=Methylocapsa acidiphila TaxID=133552 RepID=UPI00040215D5|nr:DUF429 domain-containing protein [Methylocapsa acidiphila]